MDVNFRRQSEPCSRTSRRRGFQAVVLLTVAGLTPVTWMHFYAGNRTRTVHEVPETDVALVLGAGVDGDRPSDLLARRLDIALELFRAHKVKVLLVTGDGGENRYDETGVMRRYLEDRGVPPGRIVTDDSGFSTWESCIRAKRVFGLDRAVVVTQSFHLRRALALCKAAGIDAYGVGDDSLTGDHIGPTLYGGAREIVAAIKATGQIVVRPDPRVNGTKSDAIRQALNS